MAGRIVVERKEKELLAVPLFVLRTMAMTVGIAVVYKEKVALGLITCGVRGPVSFRGHDVYLNLARAALPSAALFCFSGTSPGASFCSGLVSRKDKEEHEGKERELVYGDTSNIPSL